MLNPKQWQINREIPCIGGTGFDSVVLICVLSRIKSIGKIALLLNALRLIMHAGSWTRVYSCVGLTAAVE